MSFLLLFFPCFLFFGDRCSTDVPNWKGTTSTVEAAIYAQLYRTMRLEGIIGWGAFHQAMTDYHKIASRKQDVPILIDFSRPSTEKRFFVSDTKQYRLLFSSVVSHGKNSGGVYAIFFSNEYGSYKSPLGFYLTGTTYQGKNGHSLILNRLEGGINDRARGCAVMMHGAAYADPSVVDKGGRPGHSFDCPAVLRELTRPITDVTRGGSVMYIYTETPDYLAHSFVLPGYRA